MDISTDYQRLERVAVQKRHGTPTGLYVGIWIFFLFLYFRPQDLIPPLQAIRPVLILMVLVTIGFLISSSVKKVYLKTPFFKALVLFGGLVFLSVPLSYYPGLSISGAIDVFKVIVTCFLVMNIGDSFRRIEKIVLLMNAAIVLFAIDIIRKYLEGQGHDEIMGLVGGQFANPNDLAVNFVLFLPMIYYYFVANKNIFLKVASLCFFSIVLLGILGTQSRGGMIGAGMVLLLLVLKTEKKRLAVGAVAGMMLLLVVVGPQSAFQRLETVLNYEEESSAQSRMWFYESSVKMMLSRVVTGVGIDAWPTAYAEEFRHPEDWTNRWPDPHSTYFQIMGELGVPGITVYLFMLWVTFRSLKYLEKSYKNVGGMDRQIHFVQCLRIGLLGFSLSVIFQSFSYQHTLYNVMALVAALELVSGRDVSQISERAV